VGRANRISAPAQGGSRRCSKSLLLVLPIRWPDGLLVADVVAVLDPECLLRELIGTVQAGWGICRTMAGTVFGGVLFCAPWHEPLPVAVYSIAARFGNL